MCWKAQEWCGSSRQLASVTRGLHPATRQRRRWPHRGARLGWCFKLGQDGRLTHALRLRATTLRARADHCVLPRPSGRRGLVDIGAMAHCGRGQPRVVAVFATNGEHGEVPDDRPGETLIDRRRIEAECSAAVSGRPRREWLGYPTRHMTGWEQNTHAGCFHQDRHRDAGLRLAAIPTPDADIVVGCYDWRRLRPPDHVKVHHVLHEGPARGAAPAGARVDDEPATSFATKSARPPGSATATFNPDAPMDDGNPLRYSRGRDHLAGRRRRLHCRTAAAMEAHRSQKTDIEASSVCPEETSAPSSPPSTTSNRRMPIPRHARWLAFRRLEPHKIMAVPDRWPDRWRARLPWEVPQPPGDDSAYGLGVWSPRAARSG